MEDEAQTEATQQRGSAVTEAPPQPEAPATPQEAPKRERRNRKARSRKQSRSRIVPGVKIVLPRRSAQRRRAP